eukprot:1475296-Rhodomonas_salina.2
MNAGIPFVAKKDVIHEITFMAHDFGCYRRPGSYAVATRCPVLRQCTLRGLLRDRYAMSGTDKPYAATRHFLIPDLVYTG